MTLSGLFARCSRRHLAALSGLLLVAASALLGWLMWHRSAKGPGLPGDDEILAYVNGTPVSRYDVKLGIETTLGELGIRRLSAEAEAKMLRSVIEQRAIAMAAERELASGDLAAVDRRARSYREGLLVKAYLAQRSALPPLEEGAARRYYDAHPDRFGGGTRRVFELLATEREITPNERAAMETALRAAAEEPRWDEVERRLQADGLAVAYRRGELSPGVLEPEVTALVRQLRPGQVSELTQVRGRIYVVRVVEDRLSAPRPFEQVRAEIERSLRPAQYREALERVEREVMAEAKVVEVGGTVKAPGRAASTPAAAISAGVLADGVRGGR
ncbi:MAG: peptidyl-prolyl cis-trans isomerase [Polyangiaceae bacterium]|nr:peptidyl-prolyl cis-trans isomerase [Polyangiaceae bacterium]